MRDALSYITPLLRFHFCLSPSLRRRDGVLHKHRHGEQADAAGDGRQTARDSVDLRRVNVADERVAALNERLQATLGVVAEKLSHLRLARQAIHANVNDGRARPHVLAAYEASAPDRRDEDVGFSRHFGEVARARVAYDHGRVALQQKFGHGATDDVAPPDDARARARHLDALAREQFNDSRGRARQKRRTTKHHSTDVNRVKPVNVLLRINRLDDARLVNARGQWQLNEYAVNVLALVERGDQLKQTRGSRVSREVLVLRRDAEFF